MAAATRLAGFILLGTPLLIAGGFALWFWRRSRSRRRAACSSGFSAVAHDPKAGCGKSP